MGTSPTVRANEPTRRPTSNPIPTRVPRFRPVNIRKLGAVDEGEVIRMYFILEDVSGATVPGNGTANITIFDDLENEVFALEISVLES